jgi:hypothetical protein
MPTLDDTIKALQSQFEAIASMGQAVYKSPSNGPLREAQAWANKAVWRQLELLLREPPHLMKYPDKVTEFNAEMPYEKSVFIMTKFPEGKETIDNELGAVIEVVKNTVDSLKFHPRIASEGRYHESVWGNVEIHLLGCSRGIAIVEDLYRPELNPNVAMEWGWMRAMGKHVLYLREATFSKERADVMGLIADQFEWKDPKKDIPDAISRWLKGS